MPRFVPSSSAKAWSPGVTNPVPLSGGGMAYGVARCSSLSVYLVPLMDDTYFIQHFIQHFQHCPNHWKFDCGRSYGRHLPPQL